MSNTIIHTTETYIQTVLERTTCRVHGPGGVYPCWSFESAGGKMLFGVCDYRVKKAGFTGKISPESIRGRGHGRR